MKTMLHIAGLKGYWNDVFELGIPFILDSFYYADEAFYEYIKTDRCKHYVFDSGAFTFLNSKNNGQVDFDEYLRKYINTINKHDLKNFFELDIDAVVGLNKVEEMRKTLEYETGKKCIPVWHRGRGLQYFIDLCQNYDYISIGGLAIKNISRKEWKYLNWFCDTAHKHNCRIHGLGFTPLKSIQNFKFDTVDSTTWHNVRFGGLFTFKDGVLTRNTNSEKRIGKPKEALKHNLREWVKFQHYLYYS